ncbi:winged helix-turn-helix domain-containing protein [Tardiphaga sp. 862_B3_N1_1]|uniref:winged helix-turn-helix domain-containing protein n=1 Tax=Tardiphaga sp. 862_B3_N1_1 TaxID=3240763 RepID=UPI003F8B40B0
MMQNFPHALRADAMTHNLTFDDSKLDALSFRGFTVLPRARRIVSRGAPVDIGSRAFDILLVLLRNRGWIVAKEQIVKAVWPSTIVEESNLRVQMATLRSALGADRDVIKTIPGRGYMLVAEPPP